MEYDLMEELGFIEDNQLILDCDGVFTCNNYVKNLCTKMIRNGGKFFDVISRYEDLTTFALREEKPVQAVKIITPFLKAFGVTDHYAYNFAKKDLKVMSGARTTMGYLQNLLPTFITTDSYEHHVMAICDSLNVPMEMVTCSKIVFDSDCTNKQENKRLRELSNKIASLKIPDINYSFTGLEYLHNDDVKIVDTMNKIVEEIIEMETWSFFEDVFSVNVNEKVCTMMEIKKKTSIEFENTVFIGSDVDDYRSLDIINNDGGLAISFNGSEYAVRGCNVAVVSSNTIVLDVLVGEFYNEGIQAVADIINNWNKDYLKSCKCSDRNLMDRMLEIFPAKLPIVKIVDDYNVDAIARDSEMYRKKNQNRKNFVVCG
ncbi:MAG: hypothetical protein MJZ03_03630 [archaeon]|nr:hypothetical protein [archaeon]